MERVGAVEDFPAKEMTEVELKDKRVLVVNDGESLYVTTARCPHMNGELVHGSLEGTTITCPVHGSQFDAKTGEVIRWTSFTGILLATARRLRPPRNLKTYQTSIQEGVLFIEDSDG